MTIIEFIEARITEDEDLARGAHYEGQRWYSEEEFVGRYPDCCDCGCEVMMGANRKIEAAHVARWDPRSALAECAAKKALIAACREDHEDSLTRNDDTVELATLVLYTLAQAYSDHPDYDPAWTE